MAVGIAQSQYFLLQEVLQEVLEVRYTVLGISPPKTAHST